MEVSDNKIIQIDEEETKEVGRKSNLQQVEDRRNTLAQWMSNGATNATLIQLYKDEFGVSESQLYYDKNKVMEQWAEELKKSVKNKDATFAKFVNTIQSSIELARETKQPSAMQSGIVLLSKFLDKYSDLINLVEQKQKVIRYEIIEPNQDSENE